MTATTATSELTVTDLSANIGAEIRGVDISRPLSPDTVAEIRRIWPDRKVVFFPERSLDRGHPVIPGLKTHPEVFEIGYTAARELCATYGDVSRDKGLNWHTDVTFVARPPLGSILCAVVVPAAGGDTLFSNQQAALEGLSPALQQFLSTLTAVHDDGPQFRRAWLARHPVCPSCDGDLVETKASLVTTSAHRYVCPDWVCWRRDPAGSLLARGPTCLIRVPETIESGRRWRFPPAGL
jgi:hypothetical protein